MNAISGSIVADQQNRHLFGPLTDFLLLGGGSLIALALIRLLLGGDEDSSATSMVATAALANIINHPHFAQSYQIFYREFRAKITRYPHPLRALYVFSGIVVPALLILGLWLAVASSSATLLGMAVNLMFFFVGWHYVKQGYGMCMVDAALKQAFYTKREKKLLLWNAYATWMLSWIAANNWLSAEGGMYWGIPYTVFPAPQSLVYAAMAVSGVLLWLTASALWLRHRSGHPVALNGLIAYGTSLYAWLLLRDPIVLLWVPLFHSLQYMVVVARYQVNQEHSKQSVVRPGLRIAMFFSLSAALGYVGFWLLPTWLDAHVAYKKEIFGSSLFVFLFWIFINIHHYFLDTVMWRKGNPDVAKHLFGRSPSENAKI